MPDALDITPDTHVVLDPDPDDVTSTLRALWAELALIARGGRDVLQAEVVMAEIRRLAYRHGTEPAYPPTDDGGEID